MIYKHHFLPFGRPLFLSTSNNKPHSKPQHVSERPLFPQAIPVSCLPSSSERVFVLSDFDTSDFTCDSVVFQGTISDSSSATITPRPEHVSLVAAGLPSHFPLVVTLARLKSACAN